MVFVFIQFQRDHFHYDEEQGLDVGVGALGAFYNSAT
jgi:hypothetical protein